MLGERPEADITRLVASCEVGVHLVDVKSHGHRCDAWTFQLSATLNVPDTHCAVLPYRNHLPALLRCEHTRADYISVALELPHDLQAVRNTEKFDLVKIVPDGKDLA